MIIDKIVHEKAITQNQEHQSDATDTKNFEEYTLQNLFEFQKNMYAFVTNIYLWYGCIFGQ